jgi:hypothetical protein
VTSAHADALPIMPASAASTSSFLNDMIGPFGE